MSVTTIAGARTEVLAKQRPADGQRQELRHLAIVSWPSPSWAGCIMSINWRRSVFWMRLLRPSARHLKRILHRQIDCYHRVRTHLALDKEGPCFRPTQASEEGRVVEFKCVGGLLHEYVRMAA